MARGAKKVTKAKTSNRSKKVLASTAPVAASTSISPFSQFPAIPRIKFSTDLLERFVPVLLVICVGLSFIVGMLWQKVSNLEKGGQLAATTAQQQAAPPAVKVDLAQIKGVFDKNVIKQGDGNRKLLVVEVADPSCPYCHIAGGHNPELNKSVGPQFTLKQDGGTYIAPVPELKKLVDSGQASFAYVYSPGHGNGQMGTKAMYCANEQGKFWQVHDLLMTSAGYDLLNNVVKNDKAKSTDLANFLKGVIDSSFLKSCVESTKYDQRLTDDTNLARELGVGGTPGFFLNDTVFAGAYSYTDMEPAVKSALGS